MAAKFRFNPESLEFEGVRPSVQRTIKRVFTLVVTSFLIAAAYYFVYSAFFDTPTERAKKRENKELKAQLAVLNDKYIQLDKAIEDIAVRDSNIYRSLFESDPVSPMDNDFATDATYFDNLENMSDNELTKLTSQNLSKITKKAAKEHKIFSNLLSTIDKNKDEINYIPAIQPIENKSLTAAAASVGMRISPIFKSLKLHTGMDFAAPVGTDVVATADGTVQEIRYSHRGMGNHIVINHGDNTYETRYMYLNEIFVKKGEKVTRGQIIGKVGNLGMTMPHLHYEVRKDGKIADPLNFVFLELSPKDYESIIRISESNGQSLD